MAHRRRIQEWAVVALAWLAVGLGGAAVQAQVAGEAQVIPGTGLRLIPPAGLTLAEEFDGFVDASGQIRIEITQLPQPYRTTLVAMDEKRLAEKGIKLIAVEELRQFSSPLKLFRLAQRRAGADILFSRLILGDGRRTIFIDGIAPRDQQKTWAQPLKQAVLSVKWDANARIDPMTALGFTVTPAAPYALAQRHGQALWLAPNGQLATLPGSPAPRGAAPAAAGPPGSPGSPGSAAEFTPWFRAARHAPVASVLTLPPLQQKLVAEARIKLVPGLADAQATSSQPIQVAGLAGWEVLGLGRASNGKTNTVVHLVVLFGPQGIFSLAGVADATQSDAHLDLFRQMARSLQILPAPASETDPKPAP